MSDELESEYDVTVDFFKDVKSKKFKIMQWINVKDKMPPYDKRLLISPEKGNVSISTLVEDQQYGTVWQDQDGYMWKYETANWWMPLPKKHEE